VQELTLREVSQTTPRFIQVFLAQLRRFEDIVHARPVGTGHAAEYIDQDFVIHELASFLDANHNLEPRLNYRRHRLIIRQAGTPIFRVVSCPFSMRVTAWPH
jgi:hypothetical protein